MLFVARVLLLVLIFTGICGAVEHVVVLDEPQPGDGVVHKDLPPTYSGNFPGYLEMSIDATDVEEFDEGFFSLWLIFHYSPGFSQHEQLTELSGYEMWPHTPAMPPNREWIDGDMECQWLGGGEGSCTFRVAW